MRKQTGQSNTARGCQDGFTVLELMVVVAIFAILAATAYASMALARRPAVHQAVNYIMADIITARNEAVKDEDTCNLNFNFAPNVRSYTYTMPGTGKTKTVSLAERFRGEVFFLTGTPGGGDLAPVNTYSFSPRGMAVEAVAGIPPGGQVYVTDRDGFTSGTGKVYRIIISGSGEVDAQIRDFATATWFEFN